MKMDNWKDHLKFMELGRKPDLSSQALGHVILMKNILLQDEGHLSEMSDSGSINPKSGPIILKHMKELGGRLVYRFLHKSYDTYIWLWEDGIVELKFNGKTYVSVTGASHQEAIMVDLQNFIKKFWQPAIQQGHVYAIVVQGGRLALSTIGNAGIPLEADNYTPELMENYKFVVRDLNSSSPSGRITILEGEPGTGKTHLVRALLTEVKDAMFVLVSPDMVSSLGGPELLPLLLAHRNNQKGPIVLILEDADKCLVTRAGDNINSIQSLLNLGDGILGSLLDLRIVATTNAKKLEMEPAIMRPGRLSKRMEVGPLDIVTATAVFSRLVPEAPVPTKLSSKKHTLAEVYRMAREAGWIPPVRSASDVDDELDDEGDPREYYEDEDDDDY